MRRQHLEQEPVRLELVGGRAEPGLHRVKEAHMSKPVRRHIPLALLVASALAAPAAAQPIVCGSSIGPGKVTLTASIGPCTAATDPALTITGPAKVDMAGFFLTCDDSNPPSIGIRLLGKGVQLMGGTVNHCGIGVHLAGEGKHKLEALLVEDSDEDGFWIDSDGNKLRRLAANFSGDDGFEVDGSSNKIEEAVAFNNDDGGFRIDGSGNSLKKVLANQNERDGLFDAAGGTKIKDSAFIDNEEDGVDLAGSGATIEKSVLVMNGTMIGAGVFLDGNQNRAKQNRVFHNQANGIQTSSSAAGSTIQKNVAIGHGIDLLDGAAGGTCGSNQWQKNVFATSEADGTSSPACIE
jgi:acetyltransferase-like isoleucine patch superfamily enzyme